MRLEERTKKKNTEGGACGAPQVSDFGHSAGGCLETGSTVPIRSAKETGNTDSSQHGAGYPFSGAVGVEHRGLVSRTSEYNKEETVNKCIQKS